MRDHRGNHLLPAFGRQPRQSEEGPRRAARLVDSGDRGARDPGDRTNHQVVWIEIGAYALISLNAPVLRGWSNRRGERAMNRAAQFLVILMATVLLASPAPRAETDSAASEIAVLRRELRNLAVSNQRQINGLQAQVRALSSALAKSRAEPATGLRVAETPAPSAPLRALPIEPRPGAEVPRARMPMLPPEMSNLPGR